MSFLETILFITSDLKLTYDEKNPVQAYIIETKRTVEASLPAQLSKTEQ